MAITVARDTFVTLEEAGEYFARRFRTAAWEAARDSARERALTHAALLLNGLAWAGDKSDTTQALAFPRNGDTDAPQAIKDAQCELALALLAYRPPVRHVLKSPKTPKDGGRKAPLSLEEADATANRFRRLVGPDGGTVLVLDGDMDYQATREGSEADDIGRCGATFHDLPPIVQNLIGEYVALGARLSR